MGLPVLVVAALRAAPPALLSALLCVHRGALVRVRVPAQEAAVETARGLAGQARAITAVLQLAIKAVAAFASAAALEAALLARERAGMGALAAATRDAVGVTLVAVQRATPVAIQPAQYCAQQVVQQAPAMQLAHRTALQCALETASTGV